MIVLGDLCVVGNPPAKFIKALAVLADQLHPAIAATAPSNGVMLREPEVSKRSCVLSSIVTRDFLFRIGFRDVRLVPCMCAIRAGKDGHDIHSMGIGHPDAPPRVGEKGWPGHMVVKSPGLGYLIDTTLYPAMRPAWPELPGMIAVPTLPPDPDHRLILDREPLAAVYTTQPHDHSDLEIVWLDQPDQGWRDGPDTKRRRWHRAASHQLVQKFGTWEG